MPWREPRYEGEFPSLGGQIVAWIEQYLIHGPGDVIGEPIELDDEFYEFVVRAYRLVPETGRRQYRRAFLSRAKGRAKSELAGMLVCAEALGPVRFAGWDANGEPVGRPVKSPFIRCLATEEGQSGNTYDNVAVMMEHLAERWGDEFPGIDFGRTAQSSSRIILHHQRGEITPSTASSAAKDGGKESFAVFDETHLYTLPELRRMHEVVRRNLRKRREAEPWGLETSTMYMRGMESVAEKTHEYHQAIAEGKVKEAGLLFDHRQATDGTDLSDRDALLAGLREAYGPAAEWMDLDGIIAEIWDPQSDPSDSRRYWLNQPSFASDAWLTQTEWAGCLDLDAVIADGERITLGFDGSKHRERYVTDATALIGCRVSDGHLFEVAVWEQPEGPSGEDWWVPTVEVEAAVRKAFDRYRVVGFYADPAADWRSFVAKWEADYGSKLKARSTQQHPIEWWMNRPQITSRALEQLRAAIVTGELSHDGSFALTRHMLNARRRESRSGLQIGKEHPQSRRKIDAAIAAMLAWQARMDALAKGLNKTKASSGRVVVLS